MLGAGVAVFHKLTTSRVAENMAYFFIIILSLSQGMENGKVN